MKKTWLELIEEKEEEIIDAAKKAYREALENTHLRFIVEMDSEGEVSYWYDIAGGNSFHVSNEPDKEIKILMEFCFQCFDIMEETEGFETKEEAIEWYVDENAGEEIDYKIESVKEEIRRKELAL